MLIEIFTLRVVLVKLSRPGWLVEERISLSCGKDSWIRWSGCKDKQCRALWSGLL